MSPEVQCTKRLNCHEKILAKKLHHFKIFRFLENKVKRLESIIAILPIAGCQACDSLDKKMCTLEELYGQYSIRMLRDALIIPRGTFTTTSCETSGTILGMLNEEKNAHTFRGYTTIPNKSLAQRKLLPS